MGITFSLDLCAFSTNIHNFNRRPITFILRINFFKCDIHVQICFFVLIFQDITEKLVQFLYLVQNIWIGFSSNICCCRFSSFTYVSKCVLAYLAMSMTRLYMNSSSLDITWIRLSNVSAILLVFDGSRGEDDNNVEDEEDERLPYLLFFSWRFF